MKWSGVSAKAQRSLETIVGCERAVQEINTTLASPRQEANYKKLKKHGHLRKGDLGPGTGIQNKDEVMTSRCKKKKKRQKKEATGSQAPQDKTKVAWELPGQVATQTLFWMFCPSHDEPPFNGVGLVQLRLLFCQPRPHTALQDDQVVHVDQPPLTVKVRRRWGWRGRGWGVGFGGRE